MSATNGWGYKNKRQRLKNGCRPRKKAKASSRRGTTKGPILKTDSVLYTLKTCVRGVGGPRYLDRPVGLSIGPLKRKEGSAVNKPGLYRLTFALNGNSYCRKMIECVPAKRALSTQTE